MVAHRETLRRLVAAVAEHWSGATVEALYHRGRYELVARLRLTAGEHYLVRILLRAGMTTFFRQPPHWRTPHPMAPWAEELWGTVLCEVGLHPVERCVYWHFHTGQRLLLFLFGTAHSGALLVDAAGIPRSSLGAPQPVLESLYRQPPQERLPWTDFAPDTPLVRALAQGRSQLGTFYARELCARCGIDPETPLSRLSESERALLAQHHDLLTDELAQSTTVLLLRRPHGPPLLSLLPLREYPEVIASFTDVHEAVAERIRRTLIAEEFARARGELQQQLERLCAQVDRQYAEAETHLHHADREELYRSWGHLLLSQPDLHQRGRTEVVLTDWEGTVHHIPLNPARTLSENAQDYFERARRLEESLRRAEQRLPQLQRLRNELEQLRQELAHATSLRELRRIEQRLGELVPPREVQMRTGERFRVFALPKGYTLYVGKDARSNDALTFGFARPHDLFLHVRGMPGAHGILRGPRKGEMPPPDVLEQAAAIVAYYSRVSRKAAVPVAYTWRKYVRKLKGVPGAVRMEREEVLWVQPMAPESA